jgi:WD40 repeat protein
MKKSLHVISLFILVVALCSSEAVCHYSAKKIKIANFGKDTVKSVAFRKNDILIATVSSDEKTNIKIWNMSSDEYIANLQNDMIIWSANFSPDCTLIAIISIDLTTKIWDIINDKYIYIPEEGYINSVAFSPVSAKASAFAKASPDKSPDMPDSQLFAATTNEKTAKIWDISKKEIKCMYTLEHKSDVLSVTFGPNNKLIATTSFDNKANIFTRDDNNKYKCIATFEHNGLIWPVAFSPDKQFIATPSKDKTTKICGRNDNNEYKCIATFEPDGHINSVAFSPDSKLVATGLFDKTAKIWDINGNCITTLPHDNSVHSVTFGPQSLSEKKGCSYLVVTRSKHDVTLWGITVEY